MPAPYRYVIDKPGVPGDAIDATHFGPWFYPDDQTADLSNLTFTGDPLPDPGPEFDESSYVLDPPTPDDTYPTDLNVFATGILTGFGASQGAATALFTHETWHIMEGIAPGLGGDDDPFYFEHTLRGRRDATINALCVQLADTFWNGDWRPEWPAGAVGYEVEMVEVAADQWGPFANPVSAALDVTVAPSTYLGEALSGVVAAFALNDTWGGGDLTFDLAGLSAPDRPDIDSVGTHAYEEVTVPVTGSLSPVTFNISIPDLTSSPPYTGLLGLHYAIRVPITEGEDPIVEVRVGEDNELEINANVSVSGVYTIRPPRIRWIYDRAPYRRITQRADGLAGGARRVHPRPKSIQGSNRRGSGSIV